MPTGAKIIGVVVALIIALVIVISLLPFAQINAGHKGVVTRWGKLVRVVDEGINYRTPWAEDVYEVDVRTQKEEAQATAASKDLQDVKTTVAVNFNLVPNKVAEMWESVGKEYKSIIIDPAIQEAVKAATAKYTAEELVTKRESVKSDISASLSKRFEGVPFIALSQISITDFTFSEQFNAAIESKVRAEQDAKTSENKLKQVQFEAAQSVAKAQAEAESIRLQSAAANNDKYAQLKMLDVQLEYAKHWDGKQCTSYCFGNSSTQAPLPVITIPK